VLLALVGEVGELAELLQWLPADRVVELARDETLHRRLGEEMSDVLLYLVLLADVLDVDLAAAARAKQADARVRYPVGATPDRENRAR
jgi:dCTP diphosphatase